MFRIPSLSRTAATVDGIPCENSMPFLFVFRFFLFLMAVPSDFADLTISSSSLYGDFFHCFAFGGSLSTLAAEGAASPGGLCVGRLMSLLSFMIYF